jgi:hypothetical protein
MFVYVCVCACVCVCLCGSHRACTCRCAHGAARAAVHTGQHARLPAPEGGARVLRLRELHQRQRLGGRQHLRRGCMAARHACRAWLRTPGQVRACHGACAEQGPKDDGSTHEDEEQDRPPRGSARPHKRQVRAAPAQVRASAAATPGRAAAGMQGRGDELAALRGLTSRAMAPARPNSSASSASSVLRGKATPRAVQTQPRVWTTRHASRRRATAHRACQPHVGTWLATCSYPYGSRCTAGS